MKLTRPGLFFSATLSLSSLLPSTACNTPFKPMVVSPDPGDQRPVDMDRPDMGGDMVKVEPEFATLKGQSTGVYISEAGEVEVPDEVDGKVSVLVPKPEGGYTLMPATTSGNGMFSIDNVPKGNVWLKHGADSYIRTAARDLDLRHYHVGRLGVEELTGSKRFSLDVSGLSEWQFEDDVQLIIPNHGFIDSPLQYVEMFPEEGTTAFKDSFDWFDMSMQIVDSSKGDKTYLTQLVRKRAPGNVFYSAVLRSAVLSNFDLRGSQPELKAAFSDAAPAGAIRVKWMRSRFDAMKASVHPEAALFASEGAVKASPGGLGRVMVGLEPDLMYVIPSGDTGDVDAGSISYRNPFPATWGVFGRFENIYRITYDVPGASRRVTLTGRISVQNTPEVLSQAAIEPIIGPASMPMVNGKPAFTRQSGVTVTPTLSWSAPAVGSATGAIVTVYQLGQEDGYPFARRIATFYTKESSVSVPPDVLKSGELYCFQIRLIDDRSVDITKSPYRASAVRSFSDVLTAIISP